MPDEAFERLRLLGPYVASDAGTRRLVRCVRHHMIAASLAGDKEAAAKGERRWFDLIPALGLIHANPGAVFGPAF